jgi:hypothetical protein
MRPLGTSHTFPAKLELERDAGLGLLLFSTSSPDIVILISLLLAIYTTLISLSHGRFHR